MSVRTALLDFHVDPDYVKNGETASAVYTRVERVLEAFFGELKAISNCECDGIYVKVYTGAQALLITIRVYPDGLITTNMEYRITDESEQLMNTEISNRLEADLQHVIEGIRKTQLLANVKRGCINRYYPSSDDRWLEYDIDRIEHEEVSEYQKIEIVHSASMGNILILDGLQNLGEADQSYTATLMQKGKENYENKEILILGGGDGVLLYELLQEKPKEVIMVEIDEKVMKICAKYLRSLCGDVLDKYKGDNYEIIVDDCMVYLDKCIAEGRKFDYVFGDLTDTPISKDEKIWALIEKVVTKSFNVLKPQGKYMTHVSGLSCVSALEGYKQLLNELSPPVKCTVDKAFVPSFIEEWVFLQASVIRPEGNA